LNEDVIEFSVYKSSAGLSRIQIIFMSGNVHRKDANSAAINPTSMIS
jgi:hypothetical protein